MSWENLFLPYANNNGADQLVQPHSLISALFVHCLDSIIPLVSISKIASFLLVSSWTGRFESYLVANPEDRFSCDLAHVILTLDNDANKQKVLKDFFWIWQLEASPQNGTEIFFSNNGRITWIKHSFCNAHKMIKETPSKLFRQNTRCFNQRTNSPVTLTWHLSLS